MDEQKPTRVYKIKDCVFAYIIFLTVAVLIDRSYLSEQGTVAFIVTCTLGLIISSYMFVKSFVKHYSGIVFIVLSAVFSLPLLFSLNSVIITLSQFFSYLLFAYGIYIFGGRSGGEVLGDDSFIYLIRCIFVVPFAHYVSIFKAMFGTVKCKGKHTFLNILIGILIAIIPTACVAFLLSVSDTAFQSLLGNIAFPDNIVERVLKLCVFSIPAACYIFGMAFGNTYGAIDVAKHRHIKGINNVVMYAATIPLLVVYASYFFAQLAYFTSAFSNVLPQGLDYATYARQGFAELCVVSVINCAIVAFLHFFTSKKVDGSVRVGQKIIVILYCIFTLVLISTAISRMMLYISIYGYTHKRIYTSLFMLFLAIVFITVIIRYVFKNINATSIISVALILLFGVTAFSDIDAFCAKQNVERYISGKTGSIDISYFYELSPTAAEYVIPLLDADDKVIVNYTKLYLSNQKEDLEYMIDNGKGNIAGQKIYNMLIGLDLNIKDK